MSLKPRYALYFMPSPDDPLWRFGSAALGYDAVAGAPVPFLDHPLYREPGIAALTADPRRYGFHATLKAPFLLAEACDEAGLVSAAEAFAATQPPFHLPGLTVRALNAFVALTPATPSLALGKLADDCVRAFDAFRAPLSVQDRARRLKSPLSPRQVEYLDSWGYPYVFEEFRFHMTLTGSIPDGALRARFAEVLSERFASIDTPVSIDAVALFKQDDGEHSFRVLRRFPFPK